MSAEPTIFDLSHPGRAPDRLSAPAEGPMRIPSDHLRDTLPLPEIAELDLVRHYQRLARLDTSPDIRPQFTGSCTMKYSPKVGGVVTEFEGLRDIHPYQPLGTMQGALKLLWQMQCNLAALTGLPGVSLQPAAGSQGMLAGLLMIKAYLHDAGQDERDVVIVPDSAHGSNPATVTMCGYEVRSVSSRGDGRLDPSHLRSLLDERVAALMITHPNTAGVYEHEIEAIASMIHQGGALLYLDGANMNAFAGIVRPADLGVDVMQVNLHKTFGAPHGGSGAGSGPVLCSRALEPYLPLPIVARRDRSGNSQYVLVTQRPHSVGRVRTFIGNWSVLVRAHVFMSMLGVDGIVEATEQAVLNANYLKSLLADVVEPPLPGRCAHELVVSAEALAAHGVTVEDVAKRLMDYNFHSPLYNFPKNLVETMLVEPTESETKGEIERFAAALVAIWQEASTMPVLVRTAPHETPIGRVFDRQEQQGA